MFPEGMCCTETETMRREQVLSSRVAMRFAWRVVSTVWKLIVCFQIPCVHSDSVACVIREQSYALASMAKEKASLTLLMESGKNGGSETWRSQSFNLAQFWLRWYILDPLFFKNQTDHTAYAMILRHCDYWITFLGMIIPDKVLTKYFATLDVVSAAVELC